MGKKKKSKGGSFLMQGSILAAAGIITKIIGAVYRIPMLNIMGLKGQGYYDMAFQVLLYNAFFYFPLALVNIIRFMVQGLGFSKLAVLAGVCEMAARAIAGFVLVPMFGFTAVGFASPLAWVAADVFLIYAYRRVMGQLRITMAETLS